MNTTTIDKLQAELTAKEAQFRNTEAQLAALLQESAPTTDLQAEQDAALVLFAKERGLRRVAAALAGEIEAVRAQLAAAQLDAKRREFATISAELTTALEAEILPALWEALQTARQIKPLADRLEVLAPELRSNAVVLAHHRFQLENDLMRVLQAYPAINLGMGADNQYIIDPLPQFAGVFGKKGKVRNG